MAQQLTHRADWDERSLEFVSGGSLVRSVLGVAAVVLAILGLVGLITDTLAAIATIVVGAALIVEGGTITSHYSDLLEQAGEGRVDGNKLGGGISAEFAGGVAGVVLGILALININELPMMASAAIVLGSVLLIGSGMMARINSIIISAWGVRDVTSRLTRQAVLATAGQQMLIGVAGIALGILALIGINAMTLILIAMLAFGASILLSSSVLGPRMMHVIKS